MKNHLEIFFLNIVYLVFIVITFITLSSDLTLGDDDYSLIGGGSMPEVKIPSPVISIAASEDSNILSKLATLDTPVIPRVNDNKIIFDIRSSFESDDEIIVNALNNL